MTDKSNGAARIDSLEYWAEVHLLVALFCRALSPFAVSQMIGKDARLTFERKQRVDAENDSILHF